MPLQFHKFTFDGIGREAADGLMRADLTFNFRDDTLDQFPSVRVSTPLKHDRSATLGELEDAARAYALEALREAVSILEGTSLQALAEKPVERKEDEAARLASQFVSLGLDFSD